MCSLATLFKATNLVGTKDHSSLASYLKHHPPYSKANEQSQAK